MRLHLAYIAAYLDADGCITASLIDSSKYSRLSKSSFHTSVTFSGQDLSVLAEIMETLKTGEIRAYTSGYSGAYRLTIPTGETARVLQALLPYLRVKRQQAELMLVGLATRSRGSHKISQEIMEQRRILVDAIQAANKRAGKAYRTKWVNSVEPSGRVVARYETIPSQAVEGAGDNIVSFSSTEGVTTRRVSPNNNPAHEPPPRKGRDSLASAAT